MKQEVQKPLGVIEWTPNPGTMYKPGEMIEVRGVGELTLEDKRIYNILIENAWGPEMLDANHTFSIPMSALHPDGYGGKRERIDATLRKLQATIVELKLPNDGSRLLQLLGTADIHPTASPARVDYHFAARAGELIQSSKMFAILDLAVMKSFTSKYAFSLYEHIARRINMTYKCYETFSVSDMRDVLGVEDGKLTATKNLQSFAINPALLEVNGISSYNVSIVPKREKRKIVGYVMGWQRKTEEELRKAHAEMRRPVVGRKARLTGKAEKAA